MFVVVVVYVVGCVDGVVVVGGIYFVGARRVVRRLRRVFVGVVVVFVEGVLGVGCGCGVCEVFWIVMDVGDVVVGDCWMYVVVFG